MDANVRRLRQGPDLDCRRQRSWNTDVGVEGAHLRRSCADEPQRYDVLRWIAALHMGRTFLGMRGDAVRFVSCQAVVVLRMVVIVVEMRVQERERALRGSQRRNEQEDERPVH